MGRPAFAVHRGDLLWKRVVEILQPTRSIGYLRDYGGTFTCIEGCFNCKEGILGCFSIVFSLLVASFFGCYGSWEFSEIRLAHTC